MTSEAVKQEVKEFLGAMKELTQKALSDDCPEFVFIKFNPRRKMRGAPAARVQVDRSGVWLWMSRSDLQKNIKAFGAHSELLKALAEYK